MKRKTILRLLKDSPFPSVRDLINYQQRHYLQQDFFYKPIGIEIEITNICNLRCRGCALIIDEKNKPKDILTKQEFIRVLKESKRVGIFGYSITGGEPFLKFDLVTSILKANHGLDLYKLNTNASFFKTPAITHEYFSTLKKAGFGKKNKYIKSVLVISLGHQNLAGVPIKNAVHAASAFYDFFDPDYALCSLNLTEKYLSFSKKIYRDFLSLYVKATGKFFNERLYEVRFFSLNYVPTLRRLGILSGPKMSIDDLIEDFKKRYISRGCFNIRVNNISRGEEAETLIPRLMLRPNGDLYACPGYNRVHKIGNLLDSSLDSILKKANENIILRTVFTKNLEELYKLALKHDRSLKNRRLEKSYSPCDLCHVLTSAIKHRPLVWP